MERRDDAELADGRGARGGRPLRQLPPTGNMASVLGDMGDAVTETNVSVLIGASRKIAPLVEGIHGDEVPGPCVTKGWSRHVTRAQGRSRGVHTRVI